MSRPKSKRQSVLRKLFIARRSEIQDDLRTMSDAYDKALLTLSTAALGVSFTFLKDLIPLGEVQTLWLLFASWAMFVTAIIATLFSFPVSMWSFQDALKNAGLFYLQDDDSFNKHPRHECLLELMRWTAGTTFVLGIALTGIFIGFNVYSRSNALKELSKSSRVNDACSPLRAIEKPDFTRGRTPITSVPVPVTPGRSDSGQAPKPLAPNTPPSKPAEGKK